MNSASAPFLAMLSALAITTAHAASTCQRSSPSIIHCWDSQTGKLTTTIEHQPGSPYSYSKGPAGNFTTFFDGERAITWRTK